MQHEAGGGSPSASGALGAAGTSLSARLRHTVDVKLNPALRWQRVASVQPCAKRSRKNLRRCLAAESTNLWLAGLTAFYFTLIMMDLVVDELYCGVDDMEATLNAKAALMARIDLGFLGFFLCEILLRVFVQGWQEYLYTWLEWVDLLVVTTGILADVVMMR